MSLARVRSRAHVGVNAPLVSVEVHLGGGLPSMSIVGLPETAVKESRDRVRAAILNSGFDFPARRITVSLAPAELPKEGGGLDLPIALGILAASRQVPGGLLEDTEFMGELSLGGKLRGVRGLLPAAIQSARAGRTLILPTENGAEAALLSDGERLCAETLLQVCAWLQGRDGLPPPARRDAVQQPRCPDMSDVIGQPVPRRALEIAAAGAHNLLMSGPPGTGKSMLASRLPGILPDLEESEALETAAIASITPAGFNVRDWKRRPFRAPHHSCSGVALVGGGSIPRPGEISLAHNGVLFLDELPEFDRHALEVLREPMESGRILISRAARRAEFPARFQLVAAMNPCPCGMTGTGSGACRCSAEQIQRYLNRISGPLLDRMDIHVEVLRPEASVLQLQAADGESSSAIRKRVCITRRLQLQRQGMCNAALDVDGIRRFCTVDGARLDLLETVARQHDLSPRACHRILKLARTIADMEKMEVISRQHLAEAIALRQPGLGAPRSRNAA